MNIETKYDYFIGTSGTIMDYDANQLEAEHSSISSILGSDMSDVLNNLTNHTYITTDGPSGTKQITVPTDLKVGTVIGVFNQNNALANVLYINNVLVSLEPHNNFPNTFILLRKNSDTDYTVMGENQKDNTLVSLQGRLDSLIIDIDNLKLTGITTIEANSLNLIETDINTLKGRIESIPTATIYTLLTNVGELDSANSVLDGKLQTLETLVASINAEDILNDLDEDNTNNALDLAKTYVDSLITNMDVIIQKLNHTSNSNEILLNEQYQILSTRKRQLDLLTNYTPAKITAIKNAQIKIDSNINSMSLLPLEVSHIDDLKTNEFSAYVSSIRNLLQNIPISGAETTPITEANLSALITQFNANLNIYTKYNTIYKMSGNYRDSPPSVNVAKHKLGRYLTHLKGDPMALKTTNELDVGKYDISKMYTSTNLLEDRPFSIASYNGTETKFGLNIMGDATREVGGFPISIVTFADLETTLLKQDKSNHMDFEKTELISNKYYHTERIENEQPIPFTNDVKIYPMDSNAITLNVGVGIFGLYAVVDLGPMTINGQIVMSQISKGRTAYFEYVNGAFTEINGKDLIGTKTFSIVEGRDIKYIPYDNNESVLTPVLFNGTMRQLHVLGHLRPHSCVQIATDGITLELNFDRIEPIPEPHVINGSYAGHGWEDTIETYRTNNNNIANSSWIMIYDVANNTRALLVANVFSTGIKLAASFGGIISTESYNGVKFYFKDGVGAFVTSRHGEVINIDIFTGNFMPNIPFLSRQAINLETDVGYFSYNFSTNHVVQESLEHEVLTNKPHIQDGIIFNYIAHNSNGQFGHQVLKFLNRTVYSRYLDVGGIDKRHNDVFKHKNGNWYNLHDVIGR